MPSASLPTLDELDHLQLLTERYARYTRSAGGLSSVLGGLLCLIVFSTGLLASLSTTDRVLLALIPALWLLAKEALRRFYYQRNGAVGERLSADQRRQHRNAIAFTALISVFVIGAGLWKFGAAGMLNLPWPKLGYFSIALLMPLIVWRWLWSNSDFIVGVSLLCQAAVLIAGSHYQLNYLGIYIVAMGLLCMFYGIREHRDYLQLRTELQQSRQRLHG